MAELIFFAMLIVAILCFLDLRFGMFLLLLVGFVQDPLRKMVADSPVYFSALVMVVVAFSLIGAVGSGAVRRFSAMPGWHARLKVPVLAFVAMVVAQSAITLIYTGSIALAGIGLLVYLAPFPAILLGYSFASSVERLLAFLWTWVALSAVMVGGVYLSWLGVEWDILQSVGEPLVVYSLETGEALELPTGFLRTPEVAAWHAASGACLVLLLGFFRARQNLGLISVALALFFVGAVMLTGRRKFLVEIFVFLPIVWLLLWRFRLAAARFLYLLGAIAVASVALMLTGLAESNTLDAFQAPMARGQDRANEIFTRIESLTYGAIPYIIEANGWLGSGAGGGSGGSQYFGGGEERVGYAAEGGFGKVLAEIGVPGVLLALWLIYRVARHVWRMLGLTTRGALDGSRFTVGTTAFLLANALVFAGAHQAYSDPFILLLLGICSGFVLASHRYVVPVDKRRRHDHVSLQHAPGARHGATF